MSESFSFAGFSFPRQIPRLVCRAKPSGSWTGRRFKVNTAYTTAPEPIRGRATRAETTSYYDGSDFAPGLRMAYADECDNVRIEHTGWYTDEEGQGELMRGVVLRLPHGRGFLAGWSLGNGMAATVERSIIDNERDAAYQADRIAELAAEKECEYQAKCRAADRARELVQEIADKEALRDMIEEGLDKIDRRTVAVSIEVLTAAEARLSFLEDELKSLESDLSAIHGKHGADIADFQG